MILLPLLGIVKLQSFMVSVGVNFSIVLRFLLEFNEQRQVGKFLLL